MATTRNESGSFNVTSQSAPIHVEDISVPGDIKIGYCIETDIDEETRTPSLPIYFLPDVDQSKYIAGGAKFIEQAVDTANTIVIAGMMGIGKTISTLAYVQANKNKYKLIALFDASSAENLKASYLNLAEILGLMKISENASIDNVKQYLQNLKEASLLIYDNVINPRDTHSYLLASNKIQTIITTRFSDVTQWTSKVFTLPSLCQQEAIQLLTTHLDQPIPEEEIHFASDLVNALNYLPLSIAQASKLIKLKNISIEDCLALAKESLWEIFKEMRPETDQITIQTLKYALSALDERELSLFDAIAASPTGKPQKDVSLLQLKLISSLINKNVIRKQDNVLHCHQITQMVRKNSEQIKELFERIPLNKDAQPTTYKIFTLTGVSHATAAPSKVTTSLFTDEAGHTFFNKTIAFEINGEGNFKLDDRINLQNFKIHGDGTAILTQTIAVEEPKSPAFK